MRQEEDIIMNNDADSALKELFSQYRPDLPDSEEFVHRLIEKAAALEEIRAYHLQLRRHNRRALSAAAVAGFGTGIIFTLLFPLLMRLCSEVCLALSDVVPLIPVADFSHILSWGVVAGMVIMSSLTTYNYIFRPITVNFQNKIRL